MFNSFYLTSVESLQYLENVALSLKSKCSWKVMDKLNMDLAKNFIKFVNKEAKKF